MRKFFYINLYEDRDSCLEGVDLNKVRHGYNIPKLNFVMEDKIESNEKKIPGSDLPQNFSNSFGQIYANLLRTLSSIAIKTVFCQTNCHKV